MAFKFIRGYLTGIINRGKGGGERGQFTGRIEPVTLLQTYNVRRKNVTELLGVSDCVFYSHILHEKLQI